MGNEIKHIIKRYSRVLQWGLLLCVGLLILSSCTSEEYEQDSEKGSTQTSNKGYFSLLINTGDLLITKAFDGFEEGKLDERYVKAVRVVLYDGLDLSDQSIVKYSFDYKIESSQSIPYWKDNSTAKKDLSPIRNKFTPANFVTYAREIEVQPYRMLVIINPTRNSDPRLDLYNLTTEGVGRLSNLKKMIEVNPSLLRSQGTNMENLDAGIAADRYFLMLNDQGLIDVPASWIQETKNRAHQLPIPAYLDRVVSKVSLLPSNINDINILKPGARISGLTWALDVVNKRTYWMRQTTNSYNNSGDFGDPEIIRIHPPGELVPTIAGTDREDRYAIDPNYKGLDGKSPTAVDERRANFFSCNYQGNPFPSCLDKLLGDHIYCLENTMDKDHQFSEVSTRALIRCVYTPKNLLVGESYYLFNDEIVISLREMAEYVTIIQADLGNSWESGPYAELYSTIKSAMLFYPLGGTPDIPFVYSSNNVNNLKYYFRGVSYYAVKIRHFDYGETIPDNAYGYYGLVRNTHYKVIISDVVGPGEPLVSELEYKTRSKSNVSTSNLYNLNVTFDREDSL